MFIEKDGHTFINNDTFFSYNRQDMIDKLKELMKKFGVEVRNENLEVPLEKYLEQPDGYFYFYQPFYQPVQYIGVLADNETTQYSYKITGLCEKIISHLKTIKNIEEEKCVFSWIEYTHKFKGGSDYKEVKAKMNMLGAIASWLVDEGIFNVLGPDQTVYCNGEEVPQEVIKQLLHYYIDQF